MPPRSKKVKSKPRPRWMLSLKYERTAATTALRKRLCAAAKAHGFVRAGRVNLTGYAKWVLQNAARQYDSATISTVGPYPGQWPGAVPLQMTGCALTHPELSTPEE